MEKFTTEQRTKIVEFYFKFHRSIILTQRAYCRHFNARKPPSDFMIRRLIQRFQQYGSVSDLPRSGRPRSVFSQINRERVLDSVQEEPGTSIRRRSDQLGMPRMSLYRIPRNDLHLYPHKVELVQKLKPTDHRQRLNYSVQIQRVVNEENEFVHKLIMSDEAHFHLNGFVNKQNCRFWGFENPRAIHQHELHPLKCTV